MRPRDHRLRRGAAALAVALGLCGCNEELDPRSLLVDARVLAIVADPLEAGPDDTVALRPVVWLPPGDAVASHRWSFCPFTLGAARGYACAVAACELPLTPAADGSVSASPAQLARQCLDAVGAGGAALPPGVPSEIPQRVDLAFRYGVTTAAGTEREALQLVPFYVGGAPAVRNVAPVIQRVEIGGVEVPVGSTGPALAPGAELEIRVVLDPDSAQPFADELGNATRESLVVSFFTTAGELDADRADGPDARQTLKGDKLGAATEAELWVTARDLRGGQTVSGPYRVPIAR